MGRLAGYRAGEVGCRNYPRRRLAPSARDRAGVGSRQGAYQPAGYGFEGFEGGEGGARSQGSL